MDVDCVAHVAKKVHDDSTLVYEGRVLQSEVCKSQTERAGYVGIPTYPERKLVVHLYSFLC